MSEEAGDRLAGDGLTEFTVNYREIHPDYSNWPCKSYSSYDGNQRASNYPPLPQPTAQSYPFPGVPDVSTHEDEALQSDDLNLDHFLLQPTSGDQCETYDSAAPYQPGWGLPPKSSKRTRLSTSDISVVTPDRLTTRATPSLLSPGSTPTTTSSHLPQLRQSVPKPAPAYGTPTQPRKFSFVAQDEAYSYTVSEPGGPTAPLKEIEPVWNHQYNPQYPTQAQLQLLAVPEAGRAPSEASVGQKSSRSSSSRKQERKYCKGCNRWLANQDGYRRHCKTHDANKKDHYLQVCHCGERFPHPKDLRRHQLKHGAPVLQCCFPDCNAQISGRYDNAKRHVIQQHKIHPDHVSDYIFRQPT